MTVHERKDDKKPIKLERGICTISFNDEYFCETEDNNYLYNTIAINIQGKLKKYKIEKYDKKTRRYTAYPVKD